LNHNVQQACNINAETVPRSIGTGLHDWFQAVPMPAPPKQLQQFM
jgi:hypothetical protein